MIVKLTRLSFNHINIEFRHRPNKLKEPRDRKFSDGGRGDP